MPKSKPFIDKKNASVYHLVRRSHRDVGGHYDENGEPLDVPRDFVLMPSAETQAKIDQHKEDTLQLKEQQIHQQQQQHQHQQHQASDGEGDANDALARAKAQLKAYNLVEDYDYEKHMLPITGSGAFVSKNGHKVDPSLDLRSRSAPLEPVIKELDRQLESIAITADCMEEDVARALFDFEEGDFEEILDDFCFTAAQEPEEEELKDEFDFDAHIERLIQKARMEENGGTRVAPEDHDAWVNSASKFRGLKPFKKDENDVEDEIDYDEDGVHGDLDEFDLRDDAEVNPGVVAKLKPEEEAVLVAKFQQALLEYDSDDMGDLDDECMDIRGDKPLEGDVHFEAAMDQFLKEKKDENLLAGTRHTEIRHGGSSKVFVKGNLISFNAIEAQEVEEDDEEQKYEDVLAEADEFLANPEVDLPPEEVFIDGKSYFTLKERNPWDCESILSTYSNLDNNPAVIGRSNRRRKKKNTKKNGLDLDDDATTIPEDQPVQILLSNKTGLPLGVLPERGGNDDEDLEEDTFVSVNKGEARRKNETKAEKKTRKTAVKEERQVARIQKKMMREAIQEEFSLRAGYGDTHDVAGKTVFKYS
jgi:protein LTV1